MQGFKFHLATIVLVYMISIYNIIYKLVNSIFNWTGGELSWPTERVVNNNYKFKGLDIINLYPTYN